MRRHAAITDIAEHFASIDHLTGLDIEIVMELSRVVEISHGQAFDVDVEGRQSCLPALDRRDRLSSTPHILLQELLLFLLVAPIPAANRQPDFLHERGHTRSCHSERSEESVWEGGSGMPPTPSYLTPTPIPR